MCEKNQENKLTVQRQEETYQFIRNSVIQAQQNVYTAVNAAMVNASILFNVSNSERTAFRIKLDTLSIVNEGC